MDSVIARGKNNNNLNPVSLSPECVLPFLNLWELLYRLYGKVNVQQVEQHCFSCPPHLSPPSVNRGRRQQIDLLFTLHAIDSVIVITQHSLAVVHFVLSVLSQLRRVE